MYLPMYGLRALAAHEQAFWPYDPTSGAAGGNYSFAVAHDMAAAAANVAAQPRERLSERERQRHSERGGGWGGQREHWYLSCSIRHWYLCGETVRLFAAGPLSVFSI